MDESKELQFHVKELQIEDEKVRTFKSVQSNQVYSSFRSETFIRNSSNTQCQYLVKATAHG